MSVLPNQICRRADSQTEFDFLVISFWDFCEVSVDDSAFCIGLVDDEGAFVGIVVIVFELVDVFIDEGDVADDIFQSGELVFLSAG